MRLTERTAFNTIIIKGCQTIFGTRGKKTSPLTNAVVRLAAYEDTGLEPEEETALEAELDELRKWKQEAQEVAQALLSCVYDAGDISGVLLDNADRLSELAGKG